MIRFSSIFDLTAADWLAAMKLPPADVPDVVIVEGSWWRAQRTQWRMSLLEGVRELHFPDIFWGCWGDKKIAYSCAYGAPRTAEIIHIFGALGTPLAVQIGTCGGLQPYLKPGDVILPDLAICRDGVAHLYGSMEGAVGTSEQIDLAQRFLRDRDHTTYRGAHVTWSSLFTETPEMMDAWHRAGYIGVDMETATTFSVARHFGITAVSMLVVWDDLTRGKSFLDPLTQEEQPALDRANESVFAVALQLAAAQAPGREGQDA